MTDNKHGEPEGKPPVPPPLSHAAQGNVPDGDGVYRVSGLLVGAVSIVDADADARNAGKSAQTEPPPGLTLTQTIRWAFSHEAKYNPFTAIECYVTCILFMWGVWLLLPFQTFEANAALYRPLRTLFGGPETFWYSYSENALGAWFVALASAHLYSVYRRAKGDSLRRIVICLLMSTWFCLWILQISYDLRGQATLTYIIVICFLYFCLQAVFRKAVLR